MSMPLISPPKLMRGQGLVAALVLALLLAASTLLGGDFLRQQVIARAQGRSLRALALAREALLGYAVSYEVGHAVEGRGYLPCPDSANEGSTPLGACGARDLGVIGRLPWRTLGLADLRDGWGECLWYAVAGSIKNNPKPTSLNWDSPGQFALQRADGSPFALSVPDARAVAVVIAPGPALATQSRPPSRASGCSGSATASQDLPAYLDGAYPALFAGPLLLREGISATDPAGGNDLIAWLTIDDIFDALRRRRDHADHIRGAINAASTLLAARSADAIFLERHLGPAVGALRSGSLPPASEFGLAGSERLRHDNWRDQFRFAWCADGSACIHLTQPDAPPTQCRGALLFGGERVRQGAARQTRLSAAERADPAQYFEGDNATNLAAGIPAFSGQAQFSVADPLQPSTGDVIQCLP